MVEHTPAVENYLKAMFHLGHEGLVTTTALADALEVSPPSASSMIRRLTEGSLVRRDAHGVGLTDHGRLHALQVVRRHRLLETFLAEVLGMPWDEVHDEAEVLEHALSPALEARIAAYLGHPERDPHGDPIPSADGEHREEWADPLAAAPEGSRFRVERVSDRDPEALRYLARLGLRPGVWITVLEQEPFGGPLWVDIDGQRRALGPPLTRLVHGCAEPPP